MTQFDNELRQSLSAEDKAFLESLDSERGLFTQLGDVMQGPLKLWARFVFVLTFVFTALGFWMVWELFHAETTRGMLLWMAGAWAAWTAQIALKQWLFDRMNTFSIMREVKKLELKVAALERS